MEHDMMGNQEYLVNVWVEDELLDIRKIYEWW